MCNAYSLRHRSEAIRDIAEAMQLPLIGDLPEFPPKFSYRPRSRAPILRPAEGGVQVEMALWDFKLANEKNPPPYPRTNARADGLTKTYPWKLVANAQRCLVPADGFYEPEKPARAKGTVPWSYYCLKDETPFLMAGLFNEVTHPSTGEVITTYTIITTEASPIIQIHDRMPVLFSPDNAAAWLEDGPVNHDLLRPYPADLMTGWRVPDSARSSRSHDGPELIHKTSEIWTVEAND